MPPFLTVNYSIHYNIYFVNYFLQFFKGWVRYVLIDKYIINSIPRYAHGPQKHAHGNRRVHYAITQKPLPKKKESGRVNYI